MSGIDTGQNCVFYLIEKTKFYYIIPLIDQNTLFSKIQIISRSIPPVAKFHASQSPIYTNDYYSEGVIHG